MPSAVVSIAAGDDRACAITSDAALFCWGWGPLGDGTIRSSPVPIEITRERGARAVALGAGGICALTSAGGVDCWGAVANSPAPVQGLDPGATAIAGGDSHNCAVTAAGGVACWAYQGVRIDGGLTSGVVRIATGNMIPDCALTTTGTVACVSSSTSSETIPGLGSGVLSIAEGSENACAVTRAGGVKCWGNNGRGELGDGTTTSRADPVDVQGLTADVAQAVAVTTVGVAHFVRADEAGSREVLGRQLRRRGWGNGSDEGRAHARRRARPV